MRHPSRFFTNPRLTIQLARVAGLDRLLPARTGPFLATVVAIGALVWAAGWLLAGERRTILESREWWAQPLCFHSHELSGRTCRVS